MPVASQRKSLRMDYIHTLFFNIILHFKTPVYQAVRQLGWFRFSNRECPHHVISSSLWPPHFASVFVLQSRYMLFICFSCFSIQVSPPKFGLSHSRTVLVDFQRNLLNMTRSFVNISDPITLLSPLQVLPIFAAQILFGKYSRPSTVWRWRTEFEPATLQVNYIPVLWKF